MSLYMVMLILVYMFIFWIYLPRVTENIQLFFLSLAYFTQYDVPQLAMQI
jgi:hypothetical protein